MITSALVLLAAAIYAQNIVILRRHEIQDAVSKATSRIQHRKYILSLIPPEANISTQSFMHPHLAHRRQAYVLPHPFEWTLFYNPGALPFRPVVDYIAYDQRRDNDNSALLTGLRQRGLFQEVLDLDGLLLLRRNPAVSDAECLGEGWKAPQCIAPAKGQAAD
jgi:hypothetical protein